MAEEAEAQTQVPAATGMPIKVLILSAVVALVVGLGGMAAFYFFVIKPQSIDGPPAQGGQTSTTGQERGPGGGGATGKPEIIIALEPFIVNLADQPDVRYLKLGLSVAIETPETEARLHARMAPIRDAILVLLSSKESIEIRSPEGKLNLREEITRRVNALMPRPIVKNTYFTEFVIQ